MIPVRNSIPGTAEERYNTAFTSVRCLIERCNGLLKNRWRCLLKHRVLHYSPEMAANIVKACCVLHNMCIGRNIPVPEVEENFDYGMHVAPHAVNFENQHGNAYLLAARNIQQQLINNFN